MEKLLKSILFIALFAMPILAFGQPESCKVKYDGQRATITDFAKAYCLEFDKGTFEREAMDSFVKGNLQLRDKSNSIKKQKGGLK